MLIYISCQQKGINSITVKKIGDAQKRGYAFQELIYDLAFKCGLEARSENFRTQAGDQIDVFLTIDGKEALIEARYQEAHLGAGAIRDLHGKLERRPTNVIGIYMSMSEYTPDAITHASDYLKSGRMIILINPMEIETIFSGINIDFEEFIRTKIYYQSKDSKPHFDIKNKSSIIDEKKIYSEFMKKVKEYREIQQIEPKSYITAHSGSFGCSIFSTAFLNFAPKHYKIEAYFNNFRNYSEIINILKTYNNIFGFTKSAAFCINQTNYSWFGFGAKNFINSLYNQKARYNGLKDLQIHHSESATFIDEIPTWPGGIFSISMQPSTTLKNFIGHVSAVFLLSEIPFSIERYDAFFKKIGAEVNAIESIDWEISTRINLENYRNLELKPIKFIEEKEFIIKDEKWTDGIVCQNPFKGKSIEIEKMIKTSSSKSYSSHNLRLLTDIDYIILNLPSYHPISDKKYQYYLRHIDLVNIPSSGYPTLSINATGDWK